MPGQTYLDQTSKLPGKTRFRHSAQIFLLTAGKWRNHQFQHEDAKMAKDNLRLVRLYPQTHTYDPCTLGLDFLKFSDLRTVRICSTLCILLQCPWQLASFVFTPLRPDHPRYASGNALTNASRGSPLGGTPFIATYRAL